MNAETAPLRTSTRRSGLRLSGWPEVLMTAIPLLLYGQHFLDEPAEIPFNAIVLGLVAASGRWPLLAGLAIAAVGAGQTLDLGRGAASFSMIIAVEAVGTTGRKAWTVLAAVAASLAWFPQSAEVSKIWQDFVVTLTIMALAGAVGSLRHWRRAQQLARIATLTQHQERGYELAHSLHDSVAASLTRIAAIAERTPTLNGDRSGSDEISRLANTAIGDLRSTLTALRGIGLDRPPTSAPTGAADFSGIIAAITKGTRQLATEGIEVTSEIRASIESSLPVRTEGILLDAIHETLTNVSRHGTGHCSILVEATATAIILQVANDLGDSFSTPMTTKQGLGTLSDRVITLGGSVHAGPTGGGWATRVRIPYVA